LLRCFQIFVFVAARHARLKVPLNRNPMKLKSDRGPDFATAHHLFRNPVCSFRDRAAAVFDLFLLQRVMGRESRARSSYAPL
jgi:hypothetical protein